MTVALIVLAWIALSTIVLILRGIQSLDRIDDALDWEEHVDDALALTEPIPYLPVFTAAEIAALRAIAEADAAACTTHHFGETA